MTKTEALQYIHDNPQIYLQKARAEGYICPICGSGSGPNGTGITTKDEIHFTCFGKKRCFSWADIPDIIAIKEGLKPGSREALQRAYEVYRINPETISSTGKNTITVAGVAIDMGHAARTEQAPSATPANPPTAQREKPKVDYSADFEEWHKHISETNYHKERFLDTTVERFNLGYNARFETYEEREDGTKKYGVIWQALIIPNGPYNFIARNTNPEASKKNRYRFSTGTRTFFNIKALEQEEKPVFIVEGEIDALSVMEAGGEAIAIQNNAEGFLRNIDAQQVKQPLLLALDKDEAGQTAEAVLAAGLHEKGIPFLQADITGDYKDANEAYRNNTPAFVQDVYMAQQSIKAAKTEAQEAEQTAYMKINAAANLEDFFAEIALGKKPYATGFPMLDSKLGGGLFEGLTIVGAVTSAGKTTLTMQIADNMAKAGHDILIFSLETGRNELIARSISKETLLYCFHERIPEINALTTRAILNGEKGEEGILEAASREYAEYAKNLYIFQSLGKIGTQRIRQETARHKAITGKTPVVIIDYLQLLGQNETRYSMGTKEIMDAAVTELKCMAVDFKTPVILISSFNRDNYKADANLASFKESGGIEYSADLLLGLQYVGAGDRGFNQEKQEALASAKPRKMELKILKQRNGEWGKRILFDYFAFANYFAETGVGSKKQP